MNRVLALSVSIAFALAVHADEPAGPNDPFRAGTVWTGKRQHTLPGPGPVQTCKLEVAEIQGGRVKGTLTISNRPYQITGTYGGSILQFETNKVGPFQQSFRGVVKGGKIELEYQGTNDGGRQVSGTGTVELQQKNAPQVVKNDPPKFQRFPGQPEFEPKLQTSPLLPGPETGYKPRSPEFSRLAAAVSATYKMPGRNTHRSYDVLWTDAAQAAAAYPAPELQKVAGKMIGREKSDRNIDANAVRADLIGQAENIERRIANGEFTRREGSYENGVPVFRNVDESGPARSEARSLRNTAAKSDAELREWVKGQRDKNGFEDLFFGDGTTNNRNHMYQNLLTDSYKILKIEAKKNAGKKSDAPLIEIRRVDSSTVKIRNASRQRMTDAIVDLSWNFTKSDKIRPPKYGHAMLLFVPVWKPNEELEIEFKLKEPSVMHARANVYANEASSEDGTFSLADPKNPPDNRPGTVMLVSANPVGKGVQAWAEIDGKRAEWKVGERQLELPAEPGEHKVVVRAKFRQKTQTVYEGTVTVDAGQTYRINMPTK